MLKFLYREIFLKRFCCIPYSIQYNCRYCRMQRQKLLNVIGYITLNVGIKTSFSISLFHTIPESNMIVDNEILI